MKAKIATLTLAALLAGCGERIESAPQAGEDVQLPKIEWRVRDRLALEEIYLSSGQSLGERERLHGFAGYEGGRAVIYTLPPQRVDDDVTCTIGHEVLHIALGAYHQ